MLDRVVTRPSVAERNGEHGGSQVWTPAWASAALEATRFICCRAMSRDVVSTLRWPMASPGHDMYGSDGEIS